MNSYLKTFAYLSVSIFIFVGMVSYILDPFGMFRAYGLRTDYLLGDRVWEDQRKVKDLILDQLHPDTLIVGNSRVLKGFDLDALRLVGDLGIAHNLGLSGANMDELDYYTRIAMNSKRLSTLIIGLDIGQFTETRRQINPDTSNVKFRWEHGVFNTVSKFSYALWSHQVINAWKHVVTEPHSLTMRGEPNFDEDLKAIDRLGYRRVTLSAEYNIANGFINADWNSYERRLRLLDALIGDNCTQGTAIKLFISPVHIRHLVLLNEVGLAEKSIKWKQALVHIVNRYQERGCDVVLKDFGRITTYTKESFPEMGDRAYRMRWYWDSGHYKPALGALVLQRLFNVPSSAENFGVDLTMTNIDQSVRAERDELHQFIHDNPDIVNDVRRTIARVRITKH